MADKTDITNERATMARMLDAYGADVRRWPPHARAQVDAMSNLSDDSAARMAAEASFERVLAHGATQAPPPSLADRIVAAAQADRGATNAKTPAPHVILSVRSQARGNANMLPAAALASAALCVCLFVGIATGLDAGSATTLTQAAVALGVGPDEAATSTSDLALLDDNEDWLSGETL